MELKQIKTHLLVEMTAGLEVTYEKMESSQEVRRLKGALVSLNLSRDSVATDGVWLGNRIC
jgi:hypothetical protein